MHRQLSLDERRAALDRRLEAALEAADRTGMPRVRSEVQSFSIRWYGQLVALSHNSIADEPATDVVLPASTAIELLRAYCRSRSDLFVQLDADDPHSLSQDPTDALLAGDYLNSAAYATLGAIDHSRLPDAFETLVGVSESLFEAFDARRAWSVEDHGSFLDETAGSLGEGATVIGATFAGVDDARRKHLAAFGRSSSTARQIQCLLESDCEMFPLAPEVDERRLREYGMERLTEANRALERLATSADVEPLRAFVEEFLAGFGSE